MELAERLREENECLKNELESKENNLLIAATAGKQLLERNNELQELVDRIHAEYTVDIDELKQRNHELKSRLDVSERLLSHYPSAGDSDVQRQRFEEDKRAEIERLEEAWGKKMRELRAEWNETEENLKRETLTCKQLRQRVAQQETCVRELEEEVKRLGCVRQLEDEVQTLNGKLQDARLAKQEFENEARRLAEEKDLIQLDRDGVVQRLQDALTSRGEYEERLEESRKELAAVRKDCMEFQCQLETMRVAQLSGLRQNTGNSLFGEVEDQRLELEKKLISVEVKYDSLQKIHAITKQQLHKLKAQIGALLSTGSSQADVVRLKQLELTLYQKQSEIRKLQARMKDLQENGSKGELLSQLKSYHKAFSDFRDKRGYVELLQGELERTRARVTELQTQLDEKETLQLAKDDALQVTQNKLHKVETDAQKLRHQQAKVHIQIQDIKVKYQTDMEQLQQEVNLLRAAQAKSNKLKGSCSQEGERTPTEVDCKDMVAPLSCESLLIASVLPPHDSKLSEKSTSQPDYGSQSNDTQPQQSKRAVSFERESWKKPSTGHPPACQPPVASLLLSQSGSGISVHDSPMEMTCIHRAEPSEHDQCHGISKRQGKVTINCFDPTPKQNKDTTTLRAKDPKPFWKSHMSENKDKDMVNITGRKLGTSSARSNPKIIEAKNVAMPSECKQQ